MSYSIRSLFFHFTTFSICTICPLLIYFIYPQLFNFLQLPTSEPGPGTIQWCLSLVVDWVLVIHMCKDETTYSHIGLYCNSLSNVLYKWISTHGSKMKRCIPI